MLPPESGTPAARISEKIFSRGPNVSQAVRLMVGSNCPGVRADGCSGGAGEVPGLARVAGAMLPRGESLSRRIKGASGGERAV